MGICSFDWQLASKFIPLLTPMTALYIFRQWHKQKGTEVIANEAKLLIYNLLEMKKIVIEIENSKIKNMEELKDKFNEYKLLDKQIDSKIKFLSTDLIIEENKYKVNIYEENNDIFLNKLKSYTTKKGDNTIVEYLIYIKLTMENKDNYLIKLKNSIDELIKLSKDLALYKK